MSKKQIPSPDPDWAAELAAYDTVCEEEERAYREHHLVFTGNQVHGLSEEEIAIFAMFLNGVSCAEIAKEAEVAEGEVAAYIEVIRAKLAMDS